MHKKGDEDWNSGVLSDIPEIPTPTEESEIKETSTPVSGGGIAPVWEGAGEVKITPEEEAAYINAALQGDSNAINKLLEIYYPLILFAINRTVRGMGMRLTKEQTEDLYQDAVVFVAELIQKGTFDPTKARLSTYITNQLSFMVKNKLNPLRDKNVKPTTSIDQPIEQEEGAVSLDVPVTESRYGLFDDKETVNKMFDTYLNDPKISDKERGKRSKYVNLLKQYYKFMPLEGETEIRDKVTFDDLASLYGVTEQNIKYLINVAQEDLLKNYFTKEDIGYFTTKNPLKETERTEKRTKERIEKSREGKEGSIRVASNIKTIIYKKAILDIFDTFDLSPCEAAEVLNKVAEEIEEEGVESKRETAKEHLLNILKDIDTDEVIELLEGIIRLIEERGHEEQDLAQFNYPGVDSALDSAARGSRQW